MNAVKLIAILALLVILAGVGFVVVNLMTDFVGVEDRMATQTDPPFEVGSDIMVTGTVITTIDDCAADGVCALVLDVNGADVTAVWAEGMEPCAGSYAGDAEIGAVVEAAGLARTADQFTICPSVEYYLRPLGGGRP